MLLPDSKTESGGFNILKKNAFKPRPAYLSMEMFGKIKSFLKNFFDKNK